MPSQTTLNQGWTYTDVVHPSFEGKTILSYYSEQYCHSDQKTWRSRIEAGQVRANGKKVAPDDCLKAGQELTFHRPPWPEPNVSLNIRSLYKDDDVWVISKPSGLPVLPGGGFLTHTVLHQLQLKHPSENPVPIHRLGRGTSGVMLVARSPLARSSLSRQLRQHQMTKRYRALIGPGDAIPDQFSVTVSIGKVPHPTLGYVYGATEDGKFAQSDCQVIERRPDATLLDVTILTGRPHQIRIHTAAVGYPLLGDPLYGVGGLPLFPPPEDGTECGKWEGVAVPGDCGYWLHAHCLGFTHPRTGAWLDVSAPPPSCLCLSS